MGAFDGNYATMQAVRDAGAPSSATDAFIKARIDKWEKLVEELTGNLFIATSPGELRFDGNNSPTLFFNIPLIAVTSLKINGSDVAADSDYYIVHNGITKIKDDRKNPRLELAGGGSSIFDPVSGLKFSRGMSQLLTASWGYLESDGVGGTRCPLLITEAVVALVIYDFESYWRQYSTEQGARAPAGPVKSERTDGHAVTYAGYDGLRLRWSMLPRDIAEVLSMFRAAPTIEAPTFRVTEEVVVAAW